VILYTIEGGGHTWPGGLQYLPERIIGKTSKDLDANQLIWDFFKESSIR
jgi:polyhydroxybutyrate depolymerase